MRFPFLIHYNYSLSLSLFQSLSLQVPVSESVAWFRYSIILSIDSVENIFYDNHLNVGNKKIPLWLARSHSLPQPGRKTVEQSKESSSSSSSSSNDKLVSFYWNENNNNKSWMSVGLALLLDFHLFDFSLSLFLSFSSSLNQYFNLQYDEKFSSISSYSTRRFSPSNCSSFCSKLIIL